MKNSKESAGRPEPEGLEFPDWSGMEDSTSRLTPEAAFNLPEMYRCWFPGTIKDASLLDREKCEVEFVL